MIAGVVDTHAALWYLLRNPRLSVTARTFMDDAARAGHDIGLSPISLAEIVYLVEKNRLPLSAFEELNAALSDPGLRDRRGSIYRRRCRRDALGSSCGYSRFA